MEIPNRVKPFNFGGLLPPLADYETARFVVLPVPFEGTVTYLKGAAKGPQAVIEASRHMELYDEVLAAVIADAGIHTLEPLEVQPTSEQESLEVGRVAAQLIADKKVMAMIGGEHSITYGAVAAFKKNFDDLCVVQLDAHADLRAKGLAAVQAEILSTLTDEVYLTMDIDVFDPAFVPGTGTPEPGGLTWDEVTAFVRTLAGAKQIVGFDVVEVAPIPGSVCSEFLAARLAYRTMGCIAEAAGLLKPASPA